MMRQQPYCNSLVKLQGYNLENTNRCFLSKIKVVNNGNLVDDAIFDNNKTNQISDIIIYLELINYHQKNKEGIVVIFSQSIHTNRI